MGCLHTHGLRTSSDTRLHALAYQEKRRPFVTTGDAVGCRSTLLFSLVLRVLQGGERARQYLFRLQQVKRRDVKSIVGKKRFYPDARIPVATASSGCASLHPWVNMDTTGNLPKHTWRGLPAREFPSHALRRRSCLGELCLKPTGFTRDVLNEALIS